MTPRIVAALAWYDEPVDFLERCVASLVGFASVLVALDGRWDGMPGDDLSPDAQTVAVGAAAERAGLDLVTDARAWPSQVEKRAALMDEAAKHGDWILVIDGDEHLDPAAVPDALDDPDAWSALVSVVNENRPWPYQHLAPMAAKQRRLFRVGVTVSGPAHNDYANGVEPIEGLPTIDLARDIVIRHDNKARPPARVAAAQTYRKHRRAKRTEAAK